MKLFRASVGLFVAILCVGMALLSSPAGAEEASTPAVPAATDDSGADHVRSIQISPQAECLAKAGNWSEVEKWAWQQICAREPIDFNKRSGASVPQAKLPTLKSDPSRKLGAGFIRELFESSELTSVTQSAPVNIIGAYIPAVEVSNASIGTLRIDDSYIDDHFSLSNVTIVRSVEIYRSSIKTVRLSLVAGGKVTLYETSVKSFMASQLNIGRLSFTDAYIEQLGVSISRFSEQLSLVGGSFNEVHLTESKSDGLFIRPASLQALKIGDYADTAMFFLQVAHWTSESAIDLSTMTVGQFFLRGNQVPAKVSITGFSAGGMDWGADPLPYLKRLMAAAPYNPAIYTGLAASYAQAGQSETANAILNERQNAEFKNTKSWIDKGYLFVIWLLADYGYRPEFGLVWIAGFVLLAAVIFKSGQSQIVSGKPPDNWLVFAFDSVIPGIQLNRDYSALQFKGWRQYFVYFMRFLSAVVVVLVLEMLKKSVSGL
jgi:hypothetical protein